MNVAGGHRLQPSRESTGGQLAGNANTETARLSHMAASLQKLATGVVHGTEALSDTQREVLQDIRKEMDQISASTLIDHKEDQAEVDRARDGLAACENATMGIQDAATESSSEESSHAECRAAEKQLLTQKEAACGAYELACSNLGAPSCMQDLPSLQEGSQFHAVQECVTKISAWSSLTNTSLTENRAACAAAEEEHVSKRQECERAQAGFEMAFCSYHAALTGGCSNYTQCRAARGADRQRVHEAVRVAEAGRKSSSVAVQLIKCFLGVVEASEQEQPQQLEICSGANFSSTSQLDIEYHEAAPAVECDTSPVASYPCNEEWLAARYESQPWHSEAPAAACTACRHIKPPARTTFSKACPPTMCRLPGGDASTLLTSLTSVTRGACEAACNNYDGCTAIDFGNRHSSDPQGCSLFGNDQIQGQRVGSGNGGCFKRSPEGQFEEECSGAGTPSICRGPGFEGAGTSMSHLSTESECQDACEANPHCLAYDINRGCDCGCVHWNHSEVHGDPAGSPADEMVCMKKVIAGTTPAPTLVPTPEPTPVVLATCFNAEGQDDHRATCFDDGNYFRMVPHACAPASWEVSFDASITSISTDQSHYATFLGVGGEGLMLGYEVEATSCGANSGWHTWRAAQGSGAVHVYCDGNLVKSISDKQILVPSNAIWQSINFGVHYSMTPYPRAQMSVRDVKLLAQSETLATCFNAEGQDDHGATCFDDGNYFRMVPHACAPASWEVSFDASITDISKDPVHVATFLGVGGEGLMLGYEVEATSCGANSGWHTWRAAQGSGVVNVYCDGNLVKSISDKQILVPSNANWESINLGVHYSMRRYPRAQMSVRDVKLMTQALP